MIITLHKTVTYYEDKHRKNGKFKCNFFSFFLFLFLLLVVDHTAEHSLYKIVCRVCINYVDSVYYSLWVKEQTLSLCYKNRMPENEQWTRIRTSLQYHILTTSSYFFRCFSIVRLKVYFNFCNAALKVCGL